MVYKSGAKSWEQLPSPMPTRRREHACGVAVVRGAAVVVSIGGTRLEGDFGDALDIVEILNTATMKWRRGELTGSEIRQQVESFLLSVQLPPPDLQVFRGADGGRHLRAHRRRGRQNRRRPQHRLPLRRRRRRVARERRPTFKAPESDCGVPR